MRHVSVRQELPAAFIEQRPAARHDGALTGYNGAVENETAYRAVALDQRSSIGIEHVFARQEVGRIGEPDASPAVMTSGNNFLQCEDSMSLASSGPAFDDRG